MNKMTRTCLALGVAGMLLAAGANNALAYNGALNWVFGDLKPALGGGWITSTAQAKAIVDGLYNNLHCNGIRLPINMQDQYPSQHLSDIYWACVNEARALGMRIYANPLDNGTGGSFGLSDADYAARIKDYADTVQPYFLGCFNEPTYSNYGTVLSKSQIEDIMSQVVGHLNYNPGGGYVGPDLMHVEDSYTSYWAGDRTLRGWFDHFGSHNAGNDNDSSAGWWQSLFNNTGGMSTWSSENPRAWSEIVNGGEGGIKAVVNSGCINAVVLYKAFAQSASYGDVDGNGNLTVRGQAIANGIGSIP